MIILLEPPAQYDHPYPGQVIEQQLSLLQTMRLCHGPVNACSWLDKGVCHIVIADDEKDARLVALIHRHEVGHCNGWPHHHPDARRIEYDPDHSAEPANKPGQLNLKFQ
jgi:hypothetical protein